MHQGLSDNVLTGFAISPRNVANTGANSNVIDMQGWMGLRAVIAAGVFGTSGTIDVNVYESDNSAMASPTLIADANSGANAVIQAINSNSIKILDVWPSKRYVRIVATGQTNGTLGSVTYDQYRRQGVLPPTQNAEEYVKIRAR